MRPVSESPGSERTGEPSGIRNEHLGGPQILQRFLGKLPRISRTEWLSAQDRQLHQTGTLNSLTKHQLRKPRQRPTIGEREHRRAGEEGQE
jgi:hypothetical protein